MEKSPPLVLMLLTCKGSNKWEIVFKFCGLFTESDFQIQHKKLIKIAFQFTCLATYTPLFASAKDLILNDRILGNWRNWKQ